MHAKMACVLEQKLFNCSEKILYREADNKKLKLFVMDSVHCLGIKLVLQIHQNCGRISLKKAGVHHRLPKEIIFNSLILVEEFMFYLILHVISMNIS